MFECEEIFVYGVLKFVLLRTLVPPDILNVVYFALIQSKLSYGITFWGGAYDTTLKPIAVGQNLILKIMCFKMKWCSSWPLYYNKKILPLRHLYIFRVLKVFYLRSGNRICVKFINCIIFVKITYVLYQKVTQLNLIKFPSLLSQTI